MPEVSLDVTGLLWPINVSPGAIGIIILKQFFSPVMSPALLYNFWQASLFPKVIFNGSTFFFL